MKKYKLNLEIEGAVPDINLDDPNLKNRSYISYEKSLEKILDLSQKEYWTHYIDINRHQVIVGRNNLWVAVALIGALLALYKSQHEQVNAWSVLGILFLAAFFFVVVAFGICLYAMPARKGYSSVYRTSWADFSLLAYDQLERNEPNAYASFLSDLIEKIEAANENNIETNTARGKLFRITSWLLIAAFLLSTACTMTYAIERSNSGDCSLIFIQITDYMECIYD